MHYMNLTQPQESCIFLGHLTYHPRPFDPTTRELYLPRPNGKGGMNDPTPTQTFPPGTHEYEPKRHSLIEGVGKCMITREEAQAKFRDYRDAQGPHDEVYTDGSKIDERVGAAAVINRHFQNGETTCRQLSKRLPNNSTIFAAEATAITLALNYYRHMDPVQHDVVIYSDSMSCLQAIEGGDTNNPLICQIINLLKPTLGPPKRFRHLTRAEEVVITRLRIGHTKATKSNILSRGPPTACQHCGQTLTIEHILLECTVSQQSRDGYYTVDSLRTLF